MTSKTDDPSDITTAVVSILHFDKEAHHFSKEIYVEILDFQRDSNLVDVRGLWQPSDTWMRAYREWNNFGDHGIPHFENASELYDFNKTGARLVHELRDEVALLNSDGSDEKFKIKILPYVPLYSALQVGDATAWWHIKDAYYCGLIIPIQYLPISPSLKMRLQAWRMRQGSDSFRKELRKAFDEEGQCLEHEILTELYGSPEDIIKEIIVADQPGLHSCNA